MLGLAAVNTGNNLLFLIVAAMLGFMAVSGIFGLCNLQKLHLAVRFPDEIYCGSPSQLTLQLSSRRKRLPHYLLTLRVNGAAADFQILQPGVRQEAKVLVTFHKRGQGTLATAAVSSPFPVNFFVRSTLYSLSAPYLVFPTPVPLPHGLTHEDLKNIGTASHRRKGSSGETESIGTYTEAEPLKQIHWKLTARHDELLVKEMAAEAGKPVIIDLDALQGGIEERLCHATHIINRLMAEGQAVGLQTGDTAIPPGLTRSHRLKLLGTLANHVAD